MQRTIKLMVLILGCAALAGCATHDLRRGPKPVAIKSRVSAPVVRPVAQPVSQPVVQPAQPTKPAKVKKPKKKRRWIIF